MKPQYQHAFVSKMHAKIVDYGVHWPANGIHHGVPFSVYGSDNITRRDTLETAQGKSVSKSMIFDFMKDPGEWKRGGRKKKTRSMSFGSLVDTLLLEPDKFGTRYVLCPYPDFRKKEAKEWRKEIEAGGVEVVTEDQMASAHEACEAVQNHKDAAALLDGASVQVAFRHATKYGVASKGLIDIVPTDGETLVDLKTCSQSVLEDRRSLQRHILDFGYHIQSGCYCDGYSVASGEERTRFKFIFVTNSKPFRCAVIELPLAAILFGAEQYRSGVARFADCLERDSWPCKWDGTVELDLPDYAYID